MKESLEKMTKITVAYALTIGTMPLALVSMASVLKNAKKSDEVKFAVMYSPTDFSEKDLQILDNLKSVKGYDLKLLKIDEKIFDGFPCAEEIPMAFWFCSLLADLLPDEDTVLYLDCATMARHSLSDLFKIDLNDKLAAAIESVSFSKDNAKRIGLEDEFYFNSGVLLINLKLWRKTDLFGKLKNIVMTDRKITDIADALNKSCDNLKYRLPQKYAYVCAKQGKTALQFDDKQLKDFIKAEENPSIVQFKGINPNNVSNANKFAEEYASYAKLVPALDILQKDGDASKGNKTPLKLPLRKRLFSIETSSDGKQKTLHILGSTFKL